MKLIPVDNDPFAPSGASNGPRLVPVDHDPFATAPEEQGPPMPPRPANVPLPPPRPGDLGIGAQEFPPVQPLAGEAPAVAPRDLDGNLREQEFDANGIPVESSTDPQSIPTAPGGKNNLINRLYKKLGIDPRSVMDTGVAYDQQVQKREEAAQGLEEARANTEKEARLEDEKIRRLERAAAEGNTFARDQLAIMRSHQGQQPTVTEDAQYAQEKARTAKVTEDLRSPAIVNPGRNALESVPKTIANQAVDTASAASRIVDKVFEPIDRLIGTDVKANDKKREDYWERRRRAVDGAFNTDPALAGTFGQQVVDGIASTAGFMGAGLVGRAVGLGATATTAVAGAFPQGEQHWRMLDDWYKLHPEQDSQWKRWQNFAIGLGSGATEAAPIGHLFQRLETVGKGGLTRILGIAAAQGGEEGLQEAAQQLIQNAASRGFMDPRTPLTEDMVNSFLTAAASGALMGGGGAAIAKAMQKGPDGRPVPNLAPTPEAPPELPPELQPGGAPAPAPAVENAAPEASPEAPVRAAPAGAEGAVPSAPAPTPQEAVPAAPAAQEQSPAAPEEPAVPPPAPVSQATPDEAKLLLGAGYTADQIREMGREEIEAATADEREAGTQPVETLPPELLPQNEATSAPPATPSPASETAPSEAVSSPPLDTSGRATATSTPVQTARVEAGEGTRAKPVKAEGPEDVAVAAAQANPNPTPAQASIGNYRHGHLSFDGFDIAIENAKGSTRSGTDPDGNAWSTQMPAHYGRIKGTKGADGDQVDVYLGDKPPNGKVYVIDQFDPKTGRFDETKTFMGVDSAEEARAIYDGGFSDGSGPQRFGGIREVSTDYFRSWLNSPSRSKRPFTPEGRAKAAGKEPPPAPTPAPPPVKAFDGKWTQVGQNAAGENVWQDANGVRSVTSNGIRRTENVALRPDGTRAVDPARRSSEFKTTEELGADETPPVEDARETQRDENVRKLESQFRPKDKVAGAFYDHLVSGGSFPNILQARKMAKEQGVEDVKAVEEAMELAVVSAAKVAIFGKSEAEAFDALVDLYGRQPRLNTRTSTSVRDQAYSTPIPLAYVAQRLAQISQTDFVYEPTAGNGALLFTADPDRVIANEINKGRADNLEAQGYTVTEYDATTFDARAKILDLTGDLRIDVVIGNPPFGKVREDGRPKVFDLNSNRAGYTTTDIDHAIVVRTLGMMRPDGRAVFIVGAPGKQSDAADAYHGQNKRAFFKFLWDHYNVADHFTVSGDLYARQGTSWPVDVIVIEGRGKTERPLPAVTPPPVLTSWDQVKEKLDGRGGTDLGKPAAAAATDGAPGPAGAVSGDTRPAGQGEPAGLVPQQADAGGVREAAVQPEPEPAAGVSGEDGGPAGGGGQPAGPGARAPAKRRPPRVESADAAFDAAFDQLFGEQKPAAAPQAAPAAQPGPRADTRTPGQIVKSAATETAMGLDDALSGLYQLFGGGKTIGSGPVFDEETYAKAKPLFIAAAQHLKNAAKDLVALARAIMQSMIDKFGDAARDVVQRMRPYITRFMSDVKDGKIDLTKQEQPKAPEEKPGDQPAAPKKSAPQEKETDKQVAYKPTSSHGGLGTLVPINMQTAIQNALEKIAAEHESVDKFVAEELGFVPGSEAFHKAFAAEQVDALALALSNFKKEAGFIIGDQCVAGETRIFDPTTGLHTPIAELEEAGQPITVLSLTRGGLVPQRASAPFLKGEADLYRVTLDDGRAITVTTGHRFLSPSGWTSIDAGLRAGHFLAFAGARPECSSASALSVRRADDRHWSERGTGSPDGCLPCPHSRGERPHEVAAADRAHLPSPADALGRSRYCSDRDAKALSGARSRPHPEPARLSRTRSDVQANLSLSQTGSRAIASLASVSTRTLQSALLSRDASAWLRPGFAEARPDLHAAGAGCSTLPASETGSPRAAGTSARGSSSRPAGAMPTEGLRHSHRRRTIPVPSQVTAGLSDFPFEDHTGWCRVASIEFVRRDRFYDMLVPGTANYVAEGIVNHNTGIGKGRVNAGVIRWAIKNGMTPIFVTEKPNLYGDMYRDLKDIGTIDFLGRDIEILMTNPDEKIALDAEALDSDAERALAKQLGQPRPPERGKFLRTGGSKAHEALLQKLGQAGNAGEHDVIFTTYSQMQSVKGKETERMRFLRAVAPNAVVIFDESHNAGGQEGKPRVAKDKPAPIPRSKTARELVSLAKAVFYSSATFAKRPSVMDLYSKTDMHLAVSDIEKLAQAIKDGGVPMQQVVSTMLAEAGQYIRRERSFDGVVYDTPVVDVDREKYNEFAGALQSILEFSRSMKGAVAEIDQTIRAEAESVSRDESTGEAGAESLNFTAIMHNLISQYLLAAKVDIAADRAIQALRNGEKPVLTVASTLESFLSEFAADNDLKPGMPIELDFSQLLIRYLDRTRTITIKDAYKNKRKHYLTDEELGPEALEDYESAKQYIKDLDFGDLPISPIDWIHFRLKKEGYTTGEITGRGMVIDYRAPGKGVLRARSAREVSPSGRLQTIAKFNNEVVEEVETSPGTFVQKRKGISTIILNQAGSTGLSLHTNATFVNRQKRVMFIVQPEANIDTHMQTLGRVHRTGQVVLPRYEQLIGNVPAEKRPAAVLQKKMASLNASTTASREGALTGKDVPDFINQYGDIVAKQWLEENTEIAPALGDLQLGEQKKEADPTEDGAMRKLTGRIPLLDLDLQETVYDDLEQRYADLIEQLEATGMNALEAKALDLDARQLESVTLREGQGDSPFDGPATLGIFDIKRQGKPVTGAEVLAALARAVSSYDKDNADYYASLVLGAGTDKRKVAQAVDAINNRVRKRDKARMEEALKAGRAYIDQLVAAEEDEDKKQATRARLLENLDRFELLMRQLDPGHKVRMVLPDGDAYTGIVIKVDHGGKAKNPLALGTWRATIAVPLNNPMVPVSLASLQTGDEDGKIKLEDAAFEPLDATLDLFDQLAAGGAREKRIIATGNILAAFSSLKGKGQIISFTDHQGRKQPGIMMPAKIKKLTDITDTLGRQLTTVPEVMEFIASKFGTPIFDTSRNLEILSTGYEFTVRTPAAKGKGGRYYLDPAVLQALGRDFTKIGPWMRVVVNAARGPAIVEALLKAGARFEAPPVKKQKPIATQQRVAEPAPAAPSLTPEGGRVAQMVRDIVAQVVGTQNVRLQTPERAYSQDAEASQRSGGPAATGQEISGSVQQFISAKPIITIALAQNPDAVAKATFHEAFHVLQGYQALTPQEREIMRREYPRMEELIERTGRSTTTMSGSEVEAYAFEIYASARRAGRPAPAGLHIAVRRAFERLLQIITRIGNKLRGLGYRSADDVFAAAFTGEIGARIGTEAQVARRAESPMRGVAYSTFSPETQRDLEAYNLSVGRTPAAQRPPPPSSFQESKPGIEEGALRKLQDDFVPLRRYQQDITSQIGDIPEGRDAYLAAEAYRNRAAARLEDFKKDHVDPLIEEMLKADVGDELGVALLARHAVERNQFIEQRDPTNTAGSYLDSAAAAQIIADMQANGMWQKLLPLMDRVYNLIEADRRVRLAAGLISQQTYNDWKGRFQHYVPLQGSTAEDETEADGFSTGWGFDVRGRESQIAYGRWTIPNNPLHNVIAQAQAGIIRAEKNRVDRALLKLAQAYPNPDLWKVNERRYVPALDANGRKIMVVDHSLRHQPNVLGVKVAGKVHYITLKDMQLAEAFRLLPTDVARSAFTRGVGQLTRAYAQLQTGKNLEFFIRNVPRDLQEALFTLFVEDPRLLPSFVKSFPRSTQVAVEQALGVNRWISPRNQALYDEFRRNGGQMSFSAYRDTTTIADEVNEALGGLGKFTLAKLPGVAAKVSWRVIHTLYLKWVGAINEGFENATRLAVYMAARENGYSPAKAARMAREATVNFSRRGQWTTAISAYKMFFNPNVQGNVKTLRMLMGERDATPAQQSRARRARVLYAALPTLGFMLTLWNAAAGGDDEDEKRPGKRRLKYMGIPDYERDGNMIFIYGSHEVNGKRLPKYIKIPKSFGLGIPITLGEQMALMMLGQQTPTGAAAATMRSIMGVFNPLGSQNPFEKGFWMNQVAPTLATPAIDMTMNRDWTGRPIVPPEEPWNRGQPRSSQYFSTTSPMAIDVARWLRDKTGVDIYPGHIQYSVNWITGGAGRFYKSTWDAAANAAAGVPTPMERMPLLKQFMGKVDTAAEQDLYYKNRQDALERFNKVNAAKRTLERFPTDAPAKSDFVEGSRDLGLGFKKDRFERKNSLLGVYDQTDKEVKALRDRINAIRRDHARPLAEREQQVAELRNQMDTAMRRARRGAASYPAYQNQ